MNFDLTKDSELLRSDVARGIAPEGSIDPVGGNNDAGVIRGLSIITRGEAPGHDMWIDRTFLDQISSAVNNSGSGIKARFTHPNLSGDGLGSFLGRIHDARLDGDVVRGDLHFAKSAHKTPDGDLAGYVLELADQDPEAFGTSIAFRRDRKAERAFVEENGERSPDADNRNNFRHVRLASLRAVDAVDSPAANPNGLFHRQVDVIRDAEALMSYALGLEDEKPELVALNIDPDRCGAFFNRFLADKGLELRPIQKKETEMSDPTKTAVAAEPGDKGPGSEPVNPAVKSDVAAAAPVDQKALLADGAKAERQRQTKLRELAGEDVPSEYLDRAINEGLSVKDASTLFLTALRESRAPAVTVGKDHSEDLKDVLTDACLAAAGFPLEGKAKEAADEFKGIGLQDIARLALRAEGVDDPINRNDLFAGAISTGSFPEILGNAATKSLAKAFDEGESTFLRWAGERQVKDFKVYNDLKLSAFGVTEKVGDAGEIAHGKLTETKETYQAETYGLKFVVTRKTFINDDLNALMRIPADLGRAALRKLDDLGYDLLISNSGVGPTMNEDSKKLFATDHVQSVSNYKTGAGSVLADSGLSDGKQQLRKMKGMAGEQINVSPKSLIVPPELEHTALKLIHSSELMIRGTTDSVEPTKNIHQGTLSVIVEPRLSAATNGTTAWYLAADPAALATLILVFLAGQRGPQIERDDPSGVLGLGWRVWHDAGVAAIDFRGIHRSKGV